MVTTRIVQLAKHALNDGIFWGKTPEQTLLWYRGWLEAAEEEEHLVRRARTKAYQLANATPVIEDGELIAGRPCLRDLSPEEQKELRFHRENTARAAQRTGGQHSHMAIDYPFLLNNGIEGIISHVKSIHEELDLDNPKALERDEFYRAVLLCLKGLLKYADHYAELAQTLALSTADPRRREDLKTIAETCRRVPRYPAETFREALQSIHFVTLILEGLYQLGRPDRYLIHYYRRDIKKGIITQESAQELIDCLCIMFNTYVPQGLAAGFMVGGSNKDGQDVSNELTEMFLESIGHTRLIYPGIGFCVTPGTPEHLLKKSVRLLSEGLSHPALFNDRTIVKGLSQYGLPPEEACEYIHSTCVEITPIASSGVWVASPYINLLAPLLTILQSSGCPEAPGDFDQFLKHYRQKLAASITRETIEQNRLQKERSLHGGDPLLSCFVKDCLKHGRDIDRGGARYNWIMPSFVGLANLVDSLLTIKSLIYQKRSMKLSELYETLKNDYIENESLRQEIINRIPKYGNDDEEADKLVPVILEWIREETAKHKTWREDKFIPSLFCWIMHEKLGSVTPATPDGRKARFPLGDGSGPAQGRDTKGPTASILSATSWNHSPFIGGIAVNMKFGKSFFKDKSLDKTINLIRTFMERGGFELQINVVDRDTLLSAQREPEKYRNLAVRIGGYSDYFTRLSKGMRQEILERTEHQL